MMEEKRAAGAKGAQSYSSLTNDAIELLFLVKAHLSQRYTVTLLSMFVLLNMLKIGRHSNTSTYIWKVSVLSER
jgi:hypothetical protein